MMTYLIPLALRNRWLVLALAVAVAAFGVWTFQHQKIEAYPDISGQMVQVITAYPGRAPEEVERQVTIPIEQAMGNVPRVEVIRSRTIFGLSVVQMSFEEGVETYWARQRVQEKLAGIDLPEGVKPDLGPVATAYGEVYRYELRSDEPRDLMELRTLNDWVVIPRLLRTPGVADVSNFGGLQKQYTVTLKPSQLERFGLSLSDVLDALKSNNADAGGSVVSRGSMSFVIRGRGALRDLATIRNTFIKSIGGTPITLKDVADVGLDSRVPSGIYSKDLTEQSVEGIVLMRRGENPSEVLEKVKEAIDELNETRLPKGVRIDAFYDRTHLVESTLHTVGHSVLLGITLVVLVLLLFLGRPSVALLVALTIPFSLLFALILMNFVDIPVGLLSVGAIDFGIIVDGAVIMADSIAHRLGSSSPGGRRNTLKIILAAALEVERPIFFSVLMIIGAYLPLLTLTRIEGLLFRPMAMTLVFALIGALFFALLVVPVLATFLFRRGYREWENPLLRWFRPLYAAILRKLLYARWAVALATLVLVGGIILIVVPRLGFEFLPYMDEGVIWVRANFPEGTSLEQTSAFGQRIRAIALDYPDIKFISVQAGRNDSGTDPFPPSRMEIMIGPYPRETWKQFHTKQELITSLGDRLRREFPTTRFNFTQPIIDSVTEDANGTSANLAVEFSGPNMEKLRGLALQTVELLKRVRGAIDVGIEQEGPQPQLVIQADRALCARYNVRIEDVTRLINNAVGGEPVGTLYENERRFDIVSKFDRQYLRSPSAIGRLPVFTADGVAVPLAQVAKINVVDGQTIIARERSQRRLTVRCDIVGRDQGGFVKEAQELFEQEIEVPAGYRVAWLGMFENLQRARTHFATLIPVTIVVIFGLLVVTFGSYRAAILLLLLVPFAFIGGAVALYIRGMHLNVSTGVGFAALFGVALMDGVLMVRAITTQRQQEVALEEAIVQGAETRLRAILMTAIVAILGLLPASLATGLGSDVQRPLATVIVWGLFSAMVLTLFILPVFYRLFVPGLPRTAERGTGTEAGFVEPLPDASTGDIVELLEFVHRHGDEEEIYQIADDMNREFGSVMTVVKAAEMLGWVDTPGSRVILTPRGRAFVAAGPDDRRALWREQLLQLRLFRDIRDVLERQPDRSIDRDFVLETIITRMPYENYQRIFNTFVRWARFGELFAYDPSEQRLTLQ
jgi:cobalt-zinc-cadmium resistance protein CzcA